MNRALTLAAVGFLGLDGALFFWIAADAGRPGLYWAAGGCWGALALVLLAARQQRRRLEAITREREALKSAAEGLRHLARGE